MKRKCQNNKSQPSPDLRIRSALPSMSHTLTSHLATGRDVGNDGEVLVNTYNAIIPHNESNVKVRFDKLTTGGSTGGSAALRTGAHNKAHHLLAVPLGQKQSRPVVMAALFGGIETGGISAALKAARIALH